MLAACRRGREREERDWERASVAQSVKSVVQGVKSVTRSVHWRALILHGENTGYMAIRRDFMILCTEQVFGAA
jgi:hypothetical protein